MSSPDDIVRDASALTAQIKQRAARVTPLPAVLLLIFIVARLYLRQLSKLKFASIEPEKTSETATKVIENLGMSK